MKQKLILLFLLLLCSDLLAQNNSVNNSKIDDLIIKGDSIKKENKDDALALFKNALAIALDTKNKEKIAILYKKIGVINYSKKEYEQADLMYKYSLQNDSVTKTAADVYYNTAILKMRQNQQDSVLIYLEKGLILYNSHNLDKASYNAFLTAGIIYKNRQLYNKSLEYLFIAYDGFNALNNQKKLAAVCTTIANVHNKLKNYYQALDYHYQALRLEKSINNQQGIGTCYTNIANVNDNLKMIDSAIVNYKKALTFLEPKTTEYATVLSNLAGRYKTTNTFNLSESHYNEAIKIHKTLKDTISLLYDYNGITNLYLKNNLLKNVKFYLDSTKTLINTTKDQFIHLHYNENNVSYYQEVNNYKLALQYQIEYSNLYKNIYDIEQTEIVQTLQTQFEYEKKENEILKLSIANKNAEIELVEKNKNITNKNIILIVFAFIILLALIGYYFLIQKQKVAQQDLKIEKLEAIYQGQETIKKRIARDLHDIITTNFDGLRLKILSLKRSKNLNNGIDKITGELKDINQQIRVVSHRLYPLETQISNQKFTEIIKSRLSEFQLYGKIFVELENKLPNVLNQLSITTQNNFYGIMLEILNNIDKHSHATKVHINNYIDKKNHLHFLFLDNGIGIKKKATEGIGLLNIKQRCEILEGTCDIKKVENGTSVHISFPIKTNK